MTDAMECSVCGNEYDRGLVVVQDGVSQTFDCFECAIHQLAPRCAHCEVRIIGHGVESGALLFCCAHCARAAGQFGVRDRADADFEEVR